MEELVCASSLLPGTPSAATEREPPESPQLGHVSRGMNRVISMWAAAFLLFALAVGSFGDEDVDNSQLCSLYTTCGDCISAPECVFCMADTATDSDPFAGLFRFRHNGTSSLSSGESKNPESDCHGLRAQSPAQTERFRQRKHRRSDPSVAETTKAGSTAPASFVEVAASDPSTAGTCIARVDPVSSVCRDMRSRLCDCPRSDPEVQAHCTGLASLSRAAVVTTWLAMCALVGVVACSWASRLGIADLFARESSHDLNNVDEDDDDEDYRQEGEVFSDSSEDDEGVVDEIPPVELKQARLPVLNEV